jgi:hypothetical protein
MLSMEQITDKVVSQERLIIKRLTSYRPLMETYLQRLEKHDELAFVPVGDQYFLGKLEFTPPDPKEKTLLQKPNWAESFKSKISRLYSIQYLPAGFAQMLVVNDNLDRKNYDFEYVRREFLGTVRCLVFDVKPKSKELLGSFSGRIWVEEQNYNIVRFNGIHSPSSPSKMYFHFDSWREQMGPGV